MAKRKHAVIDALPAEPSPASIFQFGTISKVFEACEGRKKRKTIQRPPTPPVERVAPPAKASNKRKRDLNAVEEEPERVELIMPAGPSMFSRLARPQILITPRNKRWRNVDPLSPNGGASALFDQLALNSRHSSPEPEAEEVQKPNLDTPPATPEHDKSGSNKDWPVQLQEFVDLHAAFLSALSLYYSHNGAKTQVSTTALLPMVTSSWKKRSVTLDDLRRLLAVRHTGDYAFKLEDFGKGGVCIVKVQTRDRPSGLASGYIDEYGLNIKFEAALEQQWLHWADDAASFIDELPIANITQNASVAKAATPSARGGQRLADIKGQAAAKQVTQTPSATATDEPKPAAPLKRSSSLLDRVLAKQALAASTPAGPTKEELDRKSALHRVEEVSRVLELLASGRTRASFSMASIVSHLQQSLRNPISRDEVERCLGLMAGEICPAFVQIIVSGLVAGVVVTKNGKLPFAELKEKLAEMGA